MVRLGKFNTLKQVLVLLRTITQIHVWTILLWLGERFSTWVSIQSPLLGWWLEQPRACRSRNRWRFRQSALSVHWVSMKRLMLSSSLIKASPPVVLLQSEERWTIRQRSSVARDASTCQILGSLDVTRVLPMRSLRLK